MTTIAQLPPAAAALDNDVLPLQQNADGVTRNARMSQLFSYMAAKLFPTSPIGSVAVGTGAVGGIQFVTPNTANNPVTQDSGGHISAQTVTPALGSSARALSAILADQGYNIFNYSGTTQANIDLLYASVPTGNTIQVPYGATWGGTLTSPNPAKAVTWNFLGVPTLSNFAIAAGDGDLTISTANAQANYSKTFLNASAFAPIMNVIMQNFDASFPSVFAGNYAQSAAINVQAYSGPTAGGNTGSINLLMNSYGMSPAACFDIPLTVVVEKFGQTSTWAYVVNSVDQTGRLPQAFAQWNESDTTSNGHDLSPMDPTYYAGGSGTRTFLFAALSTNPLPAWPGATKPVVSKSTAQNSLVAASAIKVTASDSNPYTWYCVTGGTTGATQPTWPAPAVFTGSIAASTGVLTVSAMQTGSPNIVNNSYVSFGGTIVPIKITSFGSGLGTTGTYNTNYTGAALGPAGMYAALQVTDGSAVWQFGTDYYAQMSTAFSVNTPAADANTAVLNPFSCKCNIVLAGFDTSAATMLGAYAAAFRMAPNHVIDFSGGGTQATLNKRTMGYSTFAGANTLYYAVSGSNKFTISDAGAITFTPSTIFNIAGIASMATAGNLSGVTTGYAYPGLTVGVNASGGNLEVDFIGGPNGFSFYNATNTGVIVSSTPTLKITSSAIVCGLPLQVSSAYTSGAPTVTGYINITDASGTVRKIPCA